MKGSTLSACSSQAGTLTGLSSTRSCSAPCGHTAAQKLRPANSANTSGRTKKATTRQRHRVASVEQRRARRSAASRWRRRSPCARTRSRAARRSKAPSGPCASVAYRPARSPPPGTPRAPPHRDIAARPPAPAGWWSPAVDARSQNPAAETAAQPRRRCRTGTATAAEQGHLRLQYDLRAE